LELIGVRLKDMRMRRMRSRGKDIDMGAWTQRIPQEILVIAAVV